MVNYDLPLDVEKLYNCMAIKAVADKASNGAPLTIQEIKMLIYTFGFFGDRGKNEINEIIKGQREDVKKDADRLLELMIEKNHLPISCHKIKHEYQVCTYADCEGGITPIMSVCREDPNVKLVKKVHLSDLDAELLQKYVESEVRISGVGDSFSIPYLMDVRCTSTRTNACTECPYLTGKTVSLSNFRNELNEPYLDLEFVGIRKSTEQQILTRCVKEYFEKTAKCPLLEFGKHPNLKVTITRERVITPLIVTPALDEVTIRDVKARESLRRRVYLSGIKKDVLRTGLLIGPILKHPMDGRLTMLSICFKSTGINLDEFRVRPEHQELFRILVERSEDELIDAIGTHVCHIYGRPEAVEGNLIAFHTPLYIIWKNEQIPGWVQITNFGDTTTGKRIPRMIKQFVKLGIYTIVETSSRTGLLYFIDQSREGYILGFGEFVLADRTLIIIDGADRMNREERAEFRESYRQGFLKVRRVVSESAPMRVRVLVCENVQKPMNAYLYPCTALLENYKAPDLARVDLAIPYRIEDVASELIYKPEEETPIWIDDLQKVLRINILMAWSRKPEQVRFTEEAEKEVYQTARRFDHKYGDSEVPLISKDCDKKLAKLSAGYAAWRHSYDSEGNLIIMKEHVKHAADLIDRIYSGPGMRLDEYAKVMRKRSQLTDREFDEIKRVIDSAIEEEIKEAGKPGRPTLPITSTIVRELQIRGIASLNELQAAVAEDLSAKVSADTIRQRIMLFKKYYLVISTKEGYTLTPKGIQFMHRYNPNESEGQVSILEKIDQIKKWILEKRRDSIIDNQEVTNYIIQIGLPPQRVIDKLIEEGFLFKLIQEGKIGVAK